MSATPPILHLICGKIASGKSTLAARFDASDGTVMIAEDAWLNALYGDQMSTVADYVRCATKLRTIIGPHVTALLNAGVSVVLDFPANTIETRQWARGILDGTDAAHQLHLLNVPDEVCLARLQARNAEGDHPFAATEDQFRQITRHFVPPLPDEGFHIVTHLQDTSA
jgi:predicted kinase